MIVHLFFFYIYLMLKWARPVLSAWIRVESGSSCSLLFSMLAVEIDTEPTDSQCYVKN